MNVFVWVFSQVSAKNVALPSVLNSITVSITIAGTLESTLPLLTPERRTRGNFVPPPGQDHSLQLHPVGSTTLNINSKHSI